MYLIGTAGYSYKDWIGPFYPEGTKDGDMLAYYSGRFDFVELNSTYYHMPAMRLFASLDAKTPPEFRFSVKLFGGFTHERKSDAAEAGKFMYALKPIAESGKLVCLLAQFPYSFHCTQENMDYLRQMKQWFPDTALCMEFRNDGWINAGVMDLLRAENLGFVCVDEPRIKGLVSKVKATTSDIAYLRLHGRNAGKWYGGEGAERYDYRYNDDELMEWVPLLDEMDREASMTIVSFNNHPRGKACENARMLAGLLAQ